MAEPQPSNDAESRVRSNSISHASENSQTAADFIREQLSLEAEAREALPYQFDTCTRDLGAIRQSLYSCLDCNPPPGDSSDPYVPAAVCYACSISCHGEHTLVELFNKRNFVCDCGTTRFPATNPCTLRLNAQTGQKGDVAGEEPAKGNKYNQNFRNRFCGCNEQYDPHQEKGTMFQCLGLGTVEDGGCGEDWWHPECVVGLTREEYKKSIEKLKAQETHVTPQKVAGGITREISVTRQEEQASEHTDARRPSIVTAIAAMNGVDGNDIAAEADEDDDDPPLPPGFPHEDDFEYFLCHKCVAAFPWIKKYAGTPGFLPPVYSDAVLNAAQTKDATTSAAAQTNGESKKRKADNEEDIVDPEMAAPPKRQKSEDPLATLSSIPETTTLPLTPKKPDPATCKLPSLAPLPSPATTAPFSLFLTPTFRDALCHCPTCYPLLKPHPQLLEEEDTYEPPMSADGDGDGDGAASVGTGSLLDRGEVAFNNMDRMQAIQGAMAYAHLKDNLRAFLQPFAESGKAVGAEDIKAHFEKLRGDEQGIREAAGGAKRNGGDGEDDDGGAGGDSRREQSGY
ncbi:putative zinc finger in N-recognin-domain-containing protein [Massariosphaeria phaeospora]|uniref:Putative zinc finger in N-recognin-domain-containing protein n=1 Tax=Massariosphaeria phaeospora TaxID=100035 RepID=A0A7C8MLM6_9PLEO|nr:putative zinc finger in N-recognin-domain-containing protein [Massariosphaeria phaeospora]